ncbi:tail fiber protein [Belliella kenyensis]|uniref:Tail fiber protein n=1 Tax=Belliella kenyensis TaxID=1472724 RepID=A0ABV8EN59_9BACT|nr:tail fiber protein [Belliella kenyensis]MCH7403552.1 tail fiber protein [Belliella kenyensis]MDN3604926.1 tail fiber protein [Belliella kenyensis]
MTKSLLVFLLFLMISGRLVAQNYPTVTTKGDVVETYVSNNNAIEIGLANSLNARRAWLLSRHSTTDTYGDYYSTFHIQPDVGDKLRYRGVAIGLPPSTILPVGVHLAVNGRVGIGISTPTANLHVKGNILVEGQLSLRSSDDNSAGNISTTEEPGNQNGIRIYANRGSGKIVFETNGGGYAEKMRVSNNGNVGIGTTTPSNKLEVNGTIRAKEVKLEATNWPDYVFEKDYELMPLEAVKSFIDQKGHLPGLKSAKEYEEEGVNMLELNQKLLEKVEELTLYVLQIKYKNDEIREEIKILKSK